MSLLLTGLLFMSPQILQGVGQIVKAANPTSLKFTSDEITILKGHYQHMEKKLNYVAKILNLNIKIPPYELDEEIPDGSSLLRELITTTSLILKEYEKFITTNIIEPMTIHYFSHNISDELSEWKFVAEEQHSNLSKLDMNYFIGSELMYKLRHYEPYTLNYVYGYDQSKVIMINTMIDDAILALCRIHPSKFICPTNEFIIFPHKFKKWSVSTKPDIVEIISYNNDCSLKLIIARKYLDLIRRYDSVYDFKLLVSITYRETSVFKGSTIKSLGTYEINSILNPEWVLVLTKTGGASEILNYGQFEYELVGEIKPKNIRKENYLDLHNLKNDRDTFGSLLAEGDYTLNDPIFGISNLFSNVIGSAQFSLQTSLVILKIWMDRITTKDLTIVRHSVVRYPNIDARLDIISFSTICNKLIDTKLFQNVPSETLAQFWNRLTLDLEFMKKYIFRSSEGKYAIAHVFK